MKDSDAAVRMLKLSYESAKKSNDPNTHVGATLITKSSRQVSSHNKIIGLNNDSSRADYPKKSKCCAHAEHRAIAHAGRYEFTDMSTLFAPWFSCTDCALKIGESGVIRVIGHMAMFQHTPDRWIEDMQLAHAMLDDDYGIPLYAYDGLVNTSVRFNGQQLNV